MNDCDFCDIIARDDPDEVLWRDAHAVAFLDHRPVFHGHALVATPDHVVTLDELGPDQLARLFTAVQRVMAAQTEVLGCEGHFVANNNVISQSVPHLHVHVVPRRRKDGLRGFFWPRVKYADGEREHVHVRLRAALQGDGAA